MAQLAPSAAAPPQQPQQQPAVEDVAMRSLLQCLRSYESEIDSARRQANTSAATSSNDNQQQPSAISILPIFDRSHADYRQLRQFRPLFRAWLEARYRLRIVQVQLRRFARDFAFRRRAGQIPSISAGNETAARPGLVQQQIDTLNELKRDCDSLRRRIAQFNAAGAAPGPSSGAGPSSPGEPQSETIKFFIDWVLKQTEAIEKKITFMLQADAQRKRTQLEQLNSITTGPSSSGPGAASSSPASSGGSGTEKSNIGSYTPPTSAPTSSIASTGSSSSSRSSGSSDPSSGSSLT